MFAGRFYAALGAASDAKLSIRVVHRGLAGRSLTSAGVNRYVSVAGTSQEQVSESETVIVLGSLDNALVDEVQRVCAPLFMVFDFQEFARDVYEDIVRRFQKGEVS